MDDHDNALVLREHARRQRTGVAALVAIAEKAAVTPPLPVTQPVQRNAGRHRNIPATAEPGRHAVRFLVFGAIGGGVFLAGLAAQVGLVRGLHMNAVAAYIAQGAASVQVSFLLNRYLTWHDRSIPFWRALWRFNIQKAAVTAVNMGAYALLVRLGVQYAVANVGLTAVFTPVNYLLGHFWSFTPVASPVATAALPVPRAWSSPRRLPAASAVIPCKNNPGTIRATVTALLAQDYPNLDEVICVGDVSDPTWEALQGITDPRLIILEQEATPGRRDPNVKRDKGIRKASGDIIALVDSDIVMDPGWLSTAVHRLQQQGGGLVAGGMRSIDDTFWGRFVDRNALAAKTPRLDRPYRVTAENFGKRGFKPPITANAVFTRELYDECPLDVTWAYGYEDYEWFWRLAKDGQEILYTSELTAAHHHRRNFRSLLREYQQAAHGCGHYMKAHPDSPLSRKRLRQAFGLPLAAALGLAVLSLAALTGHATAVGGTIATAVVLLAGREVVRSRAAEAVAYPAVGLALGAAFTGSLLTSYSRVALRGNAAPEVVAGDDENEPRPPLLRRAAAHISWPLTGILALQAGLSLTLVWSNTAFGDEANYLWVGHLEIAHRLHHVPVPSYIASTLSGSPLIYPPIGAIADALGGLAAARILSLIFMLMATGILYCTALHLFGRHAAVTAAALFAVSEPCLRLAFATYDPLSVLLVALSAWCAVQASYRRHQGELVAATAAILGLAAATAYSALVIVPAVIGFAFLIWYEAFGHKALMMAGWLAGATALSYGLAMTFGHSWQGLMFTVLARSATVDASPSLLIFQISWRSIGLIIVLAAIGAMIASATEDRSRKLLVNFLLLAGILVTIGQLREHTAWSLDKHLAYSGWFAALGGGYCASKLLRAATVRRYAAVACCLVALLFPAIEGAQGAWGTFKLWANGSSFLHAFKPIAASTQGDIYLSSGTTIGQYYTPQGIQWWRWKCAGISLNLGGAESTWEHYYTHQLRADSCGVVVLFYKTTLSSPGLPGKVILGQGGASNRQELLKLVAANANPPEPGLSALTIALESDHDYRLVAVGPYNGSLADGLYAIWQRVGGAR